MIFGHGFLTSGGRGFSVHRNFLALTIQRLKTERLQGGHKASLILVEGIYSLCLSAAYLVSSVWFVH